MIEPVQFVFLTMVAFGAAMLSGTIGFGGGILMLPVLSHSLGVSEAVPILTAIQIVSNSSRAFFSYKDINWRLVGLFLSAAIPSTIIGGLAFVHMDKAIVLRLMGVLLLGYLAIVAVRWKKGEDATPSKRTFIALGALVGFLSGLIGTAGPIGAAAFLSLDLPPVVYIASDASSSMILHMVKMGVYQNSMSLPTSGWLIAVILSIATMYGAWCGRRFTQKLPKPVFRKVALAMLAISGITLLIQT